VKDRNAARNGLLRPLTGNLDATRIYILVLGQPVQKFTLAAAQIQYAVLGSMSSLMMA